MLQKSVERNKFLTEEIGDVWHDTTFREYELEIEGCTGRFIEKKCSCGNVQRMSKRYDERDQQPLCHNRSFDNWADFGTLWEFCEKQNSWWFEFWHYQIWIDMINRERFPSAIYTWLKENKIGNHFTNTNV